MKTTITIDGPNYGNWRYIELVLEGNELIISITNWDFHTMEAKLDRDEAKELANALQALT